MTNNQNYFQWELEHIQEYINKHLDFYRYYRSGATYMDEIYFVRGTKPVSNMYLDSLIYGCDGYWRFWSVLNKCKNRQSNPHIRYYKMGRNYMTIMDLCRMLHVSKRTLQRYRTQYGLPYQMLNQKIFYRESDVLRFIHEHLLGQH